MPVKEKPDATTQPEKQKEFVKAWLGEVSDALKREKKYRKLGQEVVDLYEAKTPEDTPFAILYSNTETLAPALYNARPIPIVDRRYKDPDPLGKAVSETSTRVLKFLIETEGKDYDPYDELIQDAVLNGILTNRAVTRFRYMGNEGAIPECVYGEAVRWDKFFHGYARTWKKVPWIGFEWDMSKDELKKNFPDANIDYNALTEGADDEDNKAEDKDELTGVKSTKVYELWDKRTGKVFFISYCCTDAPLRIVDDPLELANFFPIPKPLNFMRKVTTLVPTPLYQQYRQQAAELNDLTRRLKAIIKAIKYRGAYNKAVEGIEKMLTAEDNELVPVENIQSMGDGVSMDKLLWVVPVNELATTAQALYQQREACKQVIYEITGISDILRGASAASETATAQNIKNQWGTLRLKKMQKEVMRYCRDSLAIMLEIAAAKFDIQTLKQMTGLPFLTAQQKQMLNSQLQMQQQQQAAAAAQAQAAGQQPLPLQPPQIPPEIQQAMKDPSWEDITQVLQNDIALMYKVDIQTNSTIDAEAAQDKNDIAELLNGVSQFLNGVAPLVEQGVLPMEVAKEMLLVITRRFNFGSQLEDALSLMQNPALKPDPKAEADKAALAQQAQVDEQKAQIDMAKMARQGQMDQAEFDNKQKLMVLEQQVAEQALEIKREELQIQRAGLAAKALFNQQSHDLKMAALKAKPKESTNASV